MSLDQDAKVASPIFTRARKLEAVEREIKYRRRVYARLIEQGRMQAAEATLQIQIFEAIAADYREQAQQGSLL